MTTPRKKRLVYLLLPVALLILAAQATHLGAQQAGDDYVTQLPIVYEGAPLADAPSPDLALQFQATPEPSTLLRWARFEFSAPDATAFECALNGAAYEACASPLFLASVPEGDNLLSVRALSADGGVGEGHTVPWHVEALMAEGHPDLIPTSMTPSPVAEQSWRGIFRINCDFAHSSYDDPIVFPGQEDAAHLHRFYGNTELDAHTTLETLYSQGDASCQGNQLNLSAYWIPSLLAPLYDQVTGERELDANGEPAWQVVPAVVGSDDEAHELFYYSAGVDDLASIQPIPVGLRMIAGDSMTMPGSAQDTAVVRWHCQSWQSSDAANARWSATIPECHAPDRVRLDIFFPSCWDGQQLDSADHKSHMAYPVSTGGSTQCPETHPVPLLRVSYHYAFGVRPQFTHPDERSSRGWRFASDMYEVTDEQSGGLSLHGDWFNGWHPSVMEAILQNCVQAALDCHDGNLANGYRLSGTRPGSQVEPPIINGGLGH